MLSVVPRPLSGVERSPGGRRCRCCCSCLGVWLLGCFAAFVLLLPCCFAALLLLLCSVENWTRCAVHFLSPQMSPIVGTPTPSLLALGPASGAGSHPRDLHVAGASLRRPPAAANMRFPCVPTAQCVLALARGQASICVCCAAGLCWKLKSWTTSVCVCVCLCVSVCVCVFLLCCCSSSGAKTETPSPVNCTDLHLV